MYRVIFYYICFEIMICFVNNLFLEEYRLGNEWFVINVIVYVVRFCSVLKRFEERFIDYFRKLFVIFINNVEVF